MTPTNLSGLIEQLRAATEGSRELDARIAVLCGDIVMRDGGARGFAFFEPPVEKGQWAFLSGCRNGEDDAFYSLSQCLNVKHYTTDLSAIVALVEKLLPGWGYETTTPAGNGKRSCRLYPGTSFEDNAAKTVFGSGQTLPLALCIALLLALQSEVSNV